MCCFFQYGCSLVSPSCPPYLSITLLVIAQNGSPHACRQGYQSYLPKLLSRNPLTPRKSPTREKGGCGLEEHVQQLLHGARPVAQLAQAPQDCSPQQCFEALFAATQRFREEWLQKLETCQVLIARRIKSAQEQKELQLGKLSAQLQGVGSLQERDKALRKKYEAVYVTQQKIIKRVENVLHQLQRQVPVLSAAEQSMQEELQDVQDRMHDLASSLEQVHLKLSYQNKSVAQEDITSPAVTVPVPLGATQVEYIRDALAQE